VPDPDPYTDLIVETPELVTFQYRIAGLGTRSLAQLLDGCLLMAGLWESIILALLIARLGGEASAVVALIVLPFLLLAGYFPAFELAWSGQTPGKRALGIRVVGRSGEPVSGMQVAIRNLLRVIDFLPAYYGIGVVTMFINRQSRRLGDLAAGTIVVEATYQPTLERLRARLEDENPLGGSPVDILEPNLRRLVIAYSIRRPQLASPRRQEIAAGVADALAQADPQGYAAGGALSVLDRLGDEAHSAHGERPQTARAAARARRLGGAAVIMSAAFPPLVMVLGPLAMRAGSRAVQRAEAGDFEAQGAGQTARQLGFMGLFAGSLVTATGLALLAVYRG